MKVQEAISAVDAAAMADPTALVTALEEAAATTTDYRELISTIDMIIYQKMQNYFLEMTPRGSKKPKDTSVINEIYELVCEHFAQFKNPALIPTYIREEKAALIREICRFNMEDSPEDLAEAPTRLIKSYVKEVALDRTTREIDKLARDYALEHDDCHSSGDVSIGFARLFSQPAIRFAACKFNNNDDFMDSFETTAPLPEAMRQGFAKFFANRMLFAAIETNNLRLGSYAISYEADLRTLREGKSLIQIVAKKTTDLTYIPLLVCIIQQIKKLQKGLTEGDINLIRTSLALSDKDRTAISDPTLRSVLDDPSKARGSVRSSTKERRGGGSGGGFAAASTSAAAGGSPHLAKGPSDTGFAYSRSTLRRGAVVNATATARGDAVDDEAGRLGMTHLAPGEEADISRARARARRGRRMSAAAVGSVAHRAPPIPSPRLRIDTTSLDSVDGIASGVVTPGSPGALLPKVNVAGLDAATLATARTTVSVTPQPLPGFFASRELQRRSARPDIDDRTAAAPSHVAALTAHSRSSSAEGAALGGK